ncbi:hypothetical protein F2Q69_00014330 [Brassica cretica]|uniref:Uncharacterized protein n=1 Tax=Brassica cretica TaxID=69181 RepID=A0A8S9QSV9_BRACR|nr:hypothetical protein F2Q69_00014330 [Brassica cretica]
MTTIKYKKSKRKQSRSYSEFAFERYNKVSEELGRYVATERTNARSLCSDLASARARSLCSDRAEHAFGRCVATLFELLSDDSHFLHKAFRTCPAVPEATRKLNCYSHQILQAWSVQSAIPSTDTRSPPSTEVTHLPSTDIFHPTSINTSVRTSIDTEPRDMVVTLILVRDEREDMHDQEGDMRNAADQRIDAQGAAIPEYPRPLGN